MKKKRQRIVQLSERTLRKIVTRIMEAQSTKRPKVSWYGYKKSTSKGIELGIMVYEGKSSGSGDLHVPKTGIVNFDIVVPTERVGNATNTPGEEMLEKTYNNLKNQAQQWQNKNKKEYRFRNSIPTYDTLEDLGISKSPLEGESFKSNKKTSPTPTPTTESRLKKECLQESISKQFRDARKVLGEQRDLRIRATLIKEQL